MSSGRKSPISRIEFNEGEKAKKTQFGNILEQINHFVEQLSSEKKWTETRKYSVENNHGKYELFWR